MFPKETSVNFEMEMLSSISHLYCIYIFILVFEIFILHYFLLYVLWFCFLDELHISNRHNLWPSSNYSYDKRHLLLMLHLDSSCLRQVRFSWRYILLHYFSYQCNIWIYLFDIHLFGTSFTFGHSTMTTWLHSISYM